MDSRTAVRRWIDGWLRAWPAQDADGIAALYADGAIYSSHPFREPETARDYAERAFGEEDFVQAWFGEPVVSGDRAAVEYWAILSAGNRPLTLAGSAFLHFAPDGRVTEHRDYWEMQEGRREPPHGWGL